MNMLAISLFSLALATQPAADSIGGGGKGLAGHVKTGFPWQELHVQYGWNKKWGGMLQTQTALFKRWQPSIGVFRIWHEKSWRITGAFLGGWLLEDSAYPWNGPSIEARLQAAKPYGKFRPWVLLGSKHSFGWVRTEIQTQSGLLTEHDAQSEWSLTGSMGFSAAVHRGLEAGLGLDFPWIRVPSIAIPGIHLSLSYRGAK